MDKAPSRASGWLRLALPGTLLFFPACRPHFDEFTESHYVVIYKPFFARGRDAVGRKIYLAQRPGAFPSEFPAAKEKGVKRVFVVGGSVAQLLSTNADMFHLFQAALPSYRLELINCGMAGYDSYRDKLVALEVLKYDPDLVVLLSGNNEFYRPVKLNLLLYSAQQLTKRVSLLRALQNAASSPASQITPTPEQRLRQFTDNLRDIGAAARRRGVPLVYCTLPAGVNIPPRSSDEWSNAQFISGWLALDHGRLKDAVRLLRGYAARRPNEAAAFHYLARAEEASGSWSDAARDYRRSLDLQDTRCGPAKNEAIRVAARQHGILADLDAAFSETCARGLADGKALIDGVHWYQELNGFVAAIILQSARAHDLSGAVPTFASPEDWSFGNLPAPQTAYHAVGPNRKARRELLFAVKTVLYAANEPREEEAVAALREAFLLTPASVGRELLSPSALDAERAYVTTPLETVDRIRRARPRLLEHAGEALRRLGKAQQSLSYFDEALRLDPGLPWARVERAMAEAALGRSAAAQKDFSKARKLAGSSASLALFIDLAAPASATPRRITP